MSPGGRAAPAARPAGREALAAALRASLVAALVALYARAFVVAAATVSSGSMAPALLAGDRVLVARMLFARELPAALAPLLPVREVRAGDVVWLRSPEPPGTALVKRCVAVSPEPFAGAPLPPGTVAVVGDNRADSRDSRRFGPVGRAAIGGRVVLVLWSAGSGGVRWGRLGVAVR
jgi:signal peptidase I